MREAKEQGIIPSGGVRLINYDSHPDTEGSGPEGSWVNGAIREGLVAEYDWYAMPQAKRYYQKEHPVEILLAEALLRDKKPAPVNQSPGRKEPLLVVLSLDLDYFGTSDADELEPETIFEMSRDEILKELERIGAGTRRTRPLMIIISKCSGYASDTALAALPDIISVLSESADVKHDMTDNFNPNREVSPSRVKRIFNNLLGSLSVKYSVPAGIRVEAVNDPTPDIIASTPLGTRFIIGKDESIAFVARDTTTKDRDIVGYIFGIPQRFVPETDTDSRALNRNVMETFYEMACEVLPKYQHRGKDIKIALRHALRDKVRAEHQEDWGYGPTIYNHDYIAMHQDDLFSDESLMEELDAEYGQGDELFELVRGLSPVRGANTPRQYVVIKLALESASGEKKYPAGNGKNGVPDNAERLIREIQELKKEVESQHYDGLNKSDLCVDMAQKYKELGAEDLAEGALIEARQWLDGDHSNYTPTQWYIKLADAYISLFGNFEKAGELAIVAKESAYRSTPESGTPEELEQEADKYLSDLAEKKRNAPAARSLSAEKEIEPSLFFVEEYNKMAAHMGVGGRIDYALSLFEKAILMCRHLLNQNTESQRLNIFQALATACKGMDIIQRYRDGLLNELSMEETGVARKIIEKASELDMLGEVKEVKIAPDVSSNRRPTIRVGVSQASLKIADFIIYDSFLRKLTALFRIDPEFADIVLTAILAHIRAGALSGAGGMMLKANYTVANIVGPEDIDGREAEKRVVAKVGLHGTAAHLWSHVYLDPLYDTEFKTDEWVRLRAQDFFSRRFGDDPKRFEIIMAEILRIEKEYGRKLHGSGEKSFPAAEDREVWDGINIGEVDKTNKKFTGTSKKGLGHSTDFPEHRDKTIKWIRQVFGDSLKILSVGAGRGDLEIALAEAGNKVTALEYYAPFADGIRIAVSGHQTPGKEIDLKVVQGDARQILARAEDSGIGQNFDLVIFSESISTIGLNALKKAAMLVRKDGSLLVVDYKYTSPEDAKDMRKRYAVNIMRPELIREALARSVSGSVTVDTETFKDAYAGALVAFYAQKPVSGMKDGEKAYPAGDEAKRDQLKAARDSYRYIGVSMGGNKLAVSMNDGHNNMVAGPVELRWNSDERFNNGKIKDVSRADEVIEALAGMIERLFEETGTGKEKAIMINAGLAGTVDKAAGIAGADFQTSNLPFYKYNFRQKLAQRLQRYGISARVEVLNDAQAALNGERFSPGGSLRGVSGGIVIIGGGINISVGDDSIQESGHNLYQIKDGAGRIHYTWAGEKSKGKHPIERGNTAENIIRRSGDTGEEYMALGEEGFAKRHPDFPIIEWDKGLRDFEDRLSGPSMGARIKRAIEDAKNRGYAGCLEYLAIESSAEPKEMRSEVERALTPEALKGNKVAIMWIRDLAAEIGQALAAFAAFYKGRKFVDHLVLVSGVNENLGKGVYENESDRQADEDIFIKTIRHSAEKELIEYFGVDPKRAKEIAGGIVRSRMTYERELVCHQPTDEEVMAANTASAMKDGEKKYPAGDANTPETGQEPAALFGLLESQVNNERTEIVNEANGVIAAMFHNEVFRANVGAVELEKKQATAAIKDRIGRAISTVESLGRDDLSADVRQTVDHLKNRIDQLEADGIVASVINLARKAKYENQKLIIGLETDWIPGYNETGSLQHQAMNPVIQQIESIPDILRSMGLDNVVFVRS
ncbi:MAG: hypothetical protein NTY34_00310, partial [Candidatus Omnitrophica bacterium]|nr:hypothetical protein [Candidatus Omnitrophota bacterium]